MSAKSGSLGFSSPDLMLMRMLMSQQQIPQMSVGPVNDLGSGIASAGQQVVNALITRQNMARQNQMMQAVMEQMRLQQEAQQEAAQRQYAARVEGLRRAGVAEKLIPILSQTDDSSTLNLALGTVNDADAREREAQAMSATAGVTQIGQDEQGNPVMAPKIPIENARQIANLPTLEKSRLWSAITTYDINLHDPKGINLFTNIAGFAPTTEVDLVTKRANAAIAGFNSNIAQTDASFRPAEKTLGLKQTAANIASTDAGTEGKRIDNRYAPVLKQQQVDQNAVDIEQKAFKLSGDVAARALVENQVRTGGLGNIIDNAGNAAIYANLTGQGNAFTTANDNWLKIVNPEKGESPAEKMNIMGASVYPVPQAPPDQMRTEQTPSFGVQGSLFRLQAEDALKAPGRMMNSAQLDLINNWHNAEQFLGGFLGQ